MRISSFETKDGKSIDLGKFTVLVGPNNVGKSQTLKDVRAKLVDGPNSQTVLVSKIALEKPRSFDELLAGLTQHVRKDNIQITNVRGIHSNLRASEEFGLNLDQFRERFDAAPDGTFLLGNFCKLRVSYLDAASRLIVASQVPSFNPHEAAPQNLLQALFGGGQIVESHLRRAFHDTFGMEIRLDYSGMTHLCLRVGSDFPQIPEDPRLAFGVLASYSRLDDQGDGFRSFVGVVLSVLLSEGRIVLLDEPEAFLHPAQARALGAWIARHAREIPGQIVVATHNAHFLAGILSESSDAAVFRLNRSKDETIYRVIPPDSINQLIRSPLLSSQRVLESIFHKGVAVCEADADRALYQTVAEREFGNQEILFIHAHNKQTIRTIVSLLREATIPARAIADIDLLNTEGDFVALMQGLGSSDDSGKWRRLRAELAENVDGEPESSLLIRIRASIDEFSAQLAKGEHSYAGAKAALRRVVGSNRSWGSLKDKGLEAIADKPLRGRIELLIEELKTIGLFIVPAGELESWIDLGTRKKNRWIILALARVHQSSAPEPLRLFVKEILDSFAG